MEERINKNLNIMNSDDDLAFKTGQEFGRALLKTVIRSLGISPQVE